MVVQKIKQSVRLRIVHPVLAHMDTYSAFCFVFDYKFHNLPLSIWKTPAFSTGVFRFSYSSVVSVVSSEVSA